ncbi:Endonuclease/exonuclease/phosphatase [Infundibulicybe gibba]|nr:Endonuclease/exonuclease/phosphatase [Infundibulicybe gibba]
MRLLTWNINGVRTIPQYHPWNTLQTHDDILTHLGADVICFQEMKSSRPALPKAVAVPPSFHAFFSFPPKKSGYLGRGGHHRHLAASTSEERVSQQEAYPQRILLDADTDAPLDYRDIDGEGRALVFDFKLSYKADFRTALAARVKGLVEEGREVIVVGDLNACAVRGRAEGMQDEDGFWGAGARRWLREWIDVGMADIVRELWPDRRGVYKVLEHQDLRAEVELRDAH